MKMVVVEVTYTNGLAGIRINEVPDDYSKVEAQEAMNEFYKKKCNDIKCVKILKL